MELLRKESLAGLAPAAAARVLSHAYAAVVPIAPLPYPPLPLAPNRPGKHPRIITLSLALTQSCLCQTGLAVSLSMACMSLLPFLE